MRYVCLVYDEQENTDWIAGLEQAGQHVFTANLQSGTAVRSRNGHLSVADGPALLRSITIIEARDLNEAILIAARHPAARRHAVEVRPVKA